MNKLSPENLKIEQEGRRQYLSKLLRRYWFLKGQAATLGIRVDPSITTEIEDIEKEIEKAKADLQSWDDVEQGRLASQVNQLERSMKEKRLNDWFNFMNREEEKKKLHMLFPCRYLFVVDAPTGYGKSVLLSQVAAEYREEGWPVARVDLNDRYTPRTLLWSLIAKVESGEPEQQPTEPPRTDQKEGDLLLELVDVVDSRGSLCLLLDNAEQVPELAIYLRDTLIADLHDRFADAQKQIKFRCIVAGRHIKKTWAPEGTKEGTALVELSAFDVPVIEDELNNIYKAKSQGPSELEEVRHLARRVWHLCGGHPKLIAEALRRVEDKPLARRKDFKREWIKESLQEVCDTMQRKMPQEFKKVFSQVAVLRSFEAGLVEAFGRKVGFVPGQFRDGMAVITSLTERGLVVFDDLIRQYRDAIYRRILLEQAHHADSELASLHAKALEIYAARLERRDTCLRYGGDYLAVEALYHSICSGLSKEKLNANFEAYLSHLAAHYGPVGAKDCAQAIKGKLRRDYELQEELCLLIGQDDFIESELLPILDAFIKEQEQEYKNSSEG